jgi:ATP-binding cassette, subfamily C, bacterial LapB
MFKALIRNLLKNEKSTELIASTIVINLLALGSSIYSIHLLNRYVSIGLTPTLVTLTVGALIAVVFEVMLRKLRQKVLDQINSKYDQTLNLRIFNAFTTAKFESLGQVELATKREALAATTQLQQLRSTQNLGAVLDLPFAILFVLLAALLYLPFGFLALLGCLIIITMGIQCPSTTTESISDCSC